MAETTTATANPPVDTKPLSIPDFASKIRARDSRLTPDLVDDATLVRKVLERKPELTKYVESSTPRRKLTNDRTPSAEQSMRKFFENHPTLREAILGAGTGAGIPESEHPISEAAKGLAKTIYEPPKTTDEKVFEFGLPVYRLAKGLVQQTYGYGQEAFDSLDWTKVADKLKNGPYGKSDAVLTFKEGSGGKPQFAHAVAGLATELVMMLREVGKGGPEIAKKAGAAKAALGEKAMRTAQAAAGTGTQLAEDVAAKTVEGVTEHNEAELGKYETAKERHAAAVEGVEAKNAAAAKDYETSVQRLNEDYNRRIDEAKSKYADKVAEREREVARLQAEHARKVADARAKWVEKAYEAKQVAKEQAKIEGRRQALQSAQKKYADLVKENVGQTFKNVKAGLDARWDALREKIGKEATVDVVRKPAEGEDTGVKGGTETGAASKPSIFESIKQSQSMLAGVPQDLTIFKQIMKEITQSDSMIEGESGELSEVPKESIPFGDARVQFSALGEKAYAASGNLKRALMNVYDAYDRALNDTASKAGAAKDYATLKYDWSQYMKDWHDMSATGTGGSPLARLYRAVDRPVIAANVTGKFGDRLFATLARYRDMGAAPELLADMRKMFREEKSLPKSKATLPQISERATLPAAPREPEPIASDTKAAELEAERQRKLTRMAADRPTPKPLPDEPPLPDLTGRPTLDQMVDKLREAKQEQFRKYKREQTKPTRHDATMVAVALSKLHLLSSYAGMYLGIRFGWKALLDSPKGAEWLTRVTPDDVAVMKEVLDKVPEAKVETQTGIMQGLVDKVNKGEPIPPVKTFEGFLTPDQTKRLMSILMEKRKQAAGAGTHTAEGAKFDQTIFARIKAEHPEWSLSEQLRTAAKEAGQARSE